MDAFTLYYHWIQCNWARFDENFGGFIGVWGIIIEIAAAEYWWEDIFETLHYYERFNLKLSGLLVFVDYEAFNYTYQ